MTREEQNRRAMAARLDAIASILEAQNRSAAAREVSQAASELRRTASLISAKEDAERRAEEAEGLLRAVSGAPRPAMLTKGMADTLTNVNCYLARRTVLTGEKGT